MDDFLTDCSLKGRMKSAMNKRLYGQRTLSTELRDDARIQRLTLLKALFEASNENNTIKESDLTLA